MGRGWAEEKQIGEELHREGPRTGRWRPGGREWKGGERWLEGSVRRGAGCGKRSWNAQSTREGGSIEGAGEE